MAPGYIDLSELRFYTLGGDYQDDDDVAEMIEDDDDSPRRHLDGGNDFAMEGSEVDIAVFHLVS